MKRVLVTGGSGFIGSYCLPKLAAAGYEVHVVTPDAPPRASDSDAKWHQADLLDEAQTGRLFRDVAPTHLLHLAWFVAHGDYWRSTENIRWVKGGLDLARAFADAGGSRAVFAGTCVEYAPTDEPRVEGITPLRPTTLYGAAKAGLHLSVAAYLAERTVSAAWAHIFYLFGPREHPDRLVPSSIRALLEGRRFECQRPNDAFDFLYIDDLAAAFVALLESDVRGDVNLASGAATSVRDLLAEIGDEIGHPELIDCSQGDRLGASVTADVSRLNDEVGWTPRWERRDAIRATVEWWRQELHTDDQGRGTES